VSQFAGRIKKPAIFFVLLTFCFLLFDSVTKNFVTVDEVGHIPAGLSHWLSGSFNAYRVNPPLARMLAVLPVFAANRTKVRNHPSDIPGGRPEWVLGREFTKLNGKNYLLITRLARLPGIAWAIIGAWLVFR
jgi:hypothetical protein